jgi:PQQ-like domain
MKLYTNKKTMTFVITSILLLTITSQMLLIPSSNAHTPGWTIPSFAYVSVAPTPVGVGQTVQVYMWVDTPLPNAVITNDIRRHGYTLTITKPDGSVVTQNWDLITDTTGVQFYSYTPDQIGTYAIKFNYAGQNYTWSGDYLNDFFGAANATTTLTVQQDPLPIPISTYPLPTEYWTRPIEGQNTVWYTIASNWLNAPYIRTGATSTGGAGWGRFQPDGIGPESSHVMWTKSIQYGGVVGGNSTAVSGETYYMGGSYQVRFSNAIVMQGTLFYQEPYGNSGAGGDIVAVDLTTGQELWRVNSTATGTSIVPSLGYLYSFETGNQHGVLPDGLLIAPVTVTGQGTVWRAYDPRTGVLTSMNITNVPSGSASGNLSPSSGSTASIGGPLGEYLIYSLTNLGTTTNIKYYLSQWNSSNVIGTNFSNGVGTWYSGTANASANSAYDWNISIPSLKGQWSIFRDVLYNNLLLLLQGSFGTGPRTNGGGVNVTAISLNPATRGQVLWSKYYAPAPNNVTRALVAVDATAGTFVTEDKETLEINGFSLADGSHLWTTGPVVTEWDTLRRDTLSAYGRLYASGYDGILYCYDDKTGDLLWTYGNGGVGNSTYEGLGTAYGHMPMFVDVIADGKVYLGTTEHSPNSPFYKDVRYRCVNATDGTEIWTLTGWGTGMYVGANDIVADGYFVYLNCYDMQVYSVGKGPSQMTVTAPDVSVALGSSISIKGTITDISAGTTQQTQAARFPNGVAAVSDASQKLWMEYVYMQKPRPTNTIGVPVTINVVDSNGNYREIGATTSDADGYFSLNWKPDITGQYTVYASFAGSASYWPSHAVTSFAVDPAAATPAPTAAPIQSSADMYFVPAIAGLFVLIIVVAIVLALLMLRKHP